MLMRWMFVWSLWWGQVPWVMAATVEDNVLFGCAKQDKRYQVRRTGCRCLLDVCHHTFAFD